MTDDRDKDTALDGRFDAARTTLNALRAPADLEIALRHAHRDRAARRAAVEAVPATGKPIPRASRRGWIGAGAALAAGLLVAALLLPVLRSSGPAEADLDARPADADAIPVQARPQPRPFQPVAYYVGAPASQSYLILRAHVPVAAFAIDTGGYVDGTVEADLLIGDDGLVAGIRFDDIASSSNSR
jgi:hypothetical protein